MFPNIVWVWHGFSHLNRSRGVGMNGPLPITCSDIEACLNLLGIRDRDDRSEFFDHVALLDDAFLTHWYDEDKKKKKKTEKPKGVRK